MNTMNLKTYYKSRKKKYEFASRVAERCEVSLTAVLNWCNFYSTPSDEAKIQILSEESGIPVDDLFNRELN